MPNTDLNNDGKISWMEAFPYWFDRLRLFPRAFISMYIYLLYRVTEWFMALPDPSMPQAGLVSVVVGAGAAWFGLYVNSTSENDQKIVVLVIAVQQVQKQIILKRANTKCINIIYY